MEVYVLSMDVSYEGSSIISIHLTEEDARAAAQRDFDKSQADLLVMKPWNNGEADLHFKNGDRYAYQCYSISKYEVEEQDSKALYNGYEATCAAWFVAYAAPGFCSCCQKSGQVYRGYKDREPMGSACRTCASRSHSH